MTPPLIQPYLNFGGRCEEALEFYKAMLGAKVEMLMRYRESPEPPRFPLPEGYAEKVMHSSFRIGESVLMASDGCGDDTGFSGFMLSLTVADETEARRVFHALSSEGQIHMPLGKTFWSPCFGMTADRFGLGWMISVPATES